MGRNYEHGVGLWIWDVDDPKEPTSLRAPDRHPRFVTTDAILEQALKRLDDLVLTDAVRMDMSITVAIEVEPNLHAFTVGPGNDARARLLSYRPVQRLRALRRRSALAEREWRNLVTRQAVAC
jgi:hypothetical protein